MPSVIVAWKGSCRDARIRTRLLGHLHRLAMQSDDYLRSRRPERPAVLNLVSEQRGAGSRPRANIETIDRPISDRILVSSFISASPEALVESAREAGLAQIDAGADILFGERIGTADAAKERGIKSVGSLIDYTPRYPDTVFANAIWGFRPILNAAIADVKAGKPTGNNYTRFGLMKEGGSDIVYVKGVAPADAEAAMEAKRAAIKSGAFEVPIMPEEPK